MQMIRNTAIVVFLMSVAGSGALCGEAGRRSFDAYTANLEKRLAEQHSTPESYLSVLNGDDGTRTATEQELLSGSIKVEPIHGGAQPVPGGLLHHWRGAVFVHGATRGEMLALLRDFDHLPTYYAPDIQSSRALAEKRGVTTLAARLHKQNIVTVVLDGEFAVQTGFAGADCGYEVSRSSHIWQVDYPGTAHERRRSEGEDDGYLWRLNAYWSFREEHNGLLIECETVSLTRDIPVGLGWLIGPIVQELPRTSLEFTLQATRSALARKVGGGRSL